MRVVNSYRLKGCLAEHAVSVPNDVVLLSDRSRVAIEGGTPKKTSWGDYWDPEAPKPRPGPLLNGVASATTALVAHRTISGRRIEGWVGAWPTKSGSIVAFFTRDGRLLGKPKPLFSVRAKIGDVRVGARSVDGPAVVLSFLATDPGPGKVAVSLYWSVNGVFDGG